MAARITVWSNGDILTHSDLNNSFTTIRDAVNASALFKDVSSQTVSVEHVDFWRMLVKWKAFIISTVGSGFR